jgi:hypothetical protein
MRDKDYICYPPEATCSLPVGFVEQIHFEAGSCVVRAVILNAQIKKVVSPGLFFQHRADRTLDRMVATANARADAILHYDQNSGVVI